MVTVIGEAGIGKSRAIAALQEVIASEPKTGFICNVRRITMKALHPLIRHLIRAARIAPADPPGARIEKLRALVADRAASGPAAIPLPAELLSIADPPLHPLPLSPAQRKTATIALLVDEIVRLAEADPVLLVVEDAH